MSSLLTITKGPDGVVRTGRTYEVGLASFEPSQSSYDDLGYDERRASHAERRTDQCKRSMLLFRSPFQ